MKRLELLAPAKNLACGRAAIDHGADAVYIGAERFGARAAAGNSVDDIRQLCDYAHQFGAKVYVTVNTILYENELDDTRHLLQALSDARVDAVLVQDMAIVELARQHGPWHFSLHASTQTDNRTAEKVTWLKQQGFSRVVLARELSADEIAHIHRQVPDVELEVFVHGALCVSYSGLCYASQHCFRRSANRGECAQFCRMKFDLVDADGRLIEHERHLLSLKDMNQHAWLEQLIEAGACSFKIEGRLKDEAYVRNVTAAYSQRLNEIIRRNPDKYQRASLGTCQYTFTPNLHKTFNRGYTTYFLNGRQPGMASFDTPKALGEFVGTVKELRHDSFNVAGTASFANGDGLCFLTDDRQLEGFRVNKAVGNRLFPHAMPRRLRPGTRLYRNNDQEMERLLSRPSATRKMPITWHLRPTQDGFSLQADGQQPVTVVCQHQTAQKSQYENIVRQLAKLGDTPFECVKVDLPDDFNYFIPTSLLTALRREAIRQITIPLAKETNQDANILPSAPHPRPSVTTPPPYARPYLYNISNQQARQFYADRGLSDVGSAYELQPDAAGPIMQCRYCLRHALGFCTKNGGRHPQWREPLFLQLADGRRFRLEFQCGPCQMNIYSTPHAKTTQ